MDQIVIVSIILYFDPGIRIDQVVRSTKFLDHPRKIEKFKKLKIQFSVFKLLKISEKRKLVIRERNKKLFILI